MNFKYVLFCVLTIGLLLSCKSKRKVIQNTKETTQLIEVKPKVVVTAVTKPTSNSSIKNSTLEYIEAFKNIAMEEMRIYKIPASITLAQGILESSSGNSQLTRNSNNHFGIKCHKGWEGEKIYHDDDEKGECFRVYKDPNKSYKDHSEFLTTRSRYASLFKLKKGDYVRWAKGLSSAGYATDRRYPAKLIALIEKYELHKLDLEVLGKSYENEVIIEQNSHIVIKGDTLYSISKKYGLTVEELKNINGLNSNSISIGQTLSTSK